MVSKKVKLKFKKDIVPSAEAHISVDDLLSRLGSLHEELSLLVQDETDLNSLEKCSSDLVSKKLLRHKDSGVRAFVACCLSDILRLSAPDAPYTESQLTEIIKLFLQEFSRLGDPEGGYHIQQTYLITRLLEYRSIVLLSDLPTAAKLLEELFNIFYDDSKSFNQSLYKVIGGLLGEVISEFETVPFPVLKIIFNKFLTFDVHSLPRGLGVASNCGHQISLILCDAYSSRMSRHFTKYYSEYLYEISNDDNNAYEDTREALQILTKLHNLLIKVWEAVPDLAAPVMGFIYHELCAEKEFLRKKATHLISQLLIIDSDANLVTAYPDVFNAWLSKIADISVDVRLQWIDSIADILKVRDDISNEIGKGLSKTLIDTDGKIRKASVLVFKTLSIERVWLTIKNVYAYSSLLRLTREKSKDVRETSISTVATLYSRSIEHIGRSSENQNIWEIIDTIPSLLYDLYYINDPHINEQVDEVVFEILLFDSSDDKERVDRLMTILEKFDKKAFAAFFAFNKRQSQVSLALEKFVEFSEMLNNDKSDTTDNTITSTKLSKTIDWLVSGLSDSSKGNSALDALRELNDKRIYYLIKSCIASDIKFISWKNSFKELMSKLQDPSLLRTSNIRATSTIVPKDIAKQMKILLYKGSPIIYNVSNIAQFLDGKNEHSKLKQKLLNDISETNPALLKSQVVKLQTTVKDSNQEDSTEKNLIIEDALKTLYKIGKNFDRDIDFSDSFLITRLSDFILEGSPTAAKYATKILALFPDAFVHLSKIKTLILPLDVINDKNFVSHLLAISEIFRFHPDILNENSTDIVSYLIKEVLLSNEMVPKHVKNIEWVDKDALFTNEYSALNCKITCLKLFTNKLKSIASEADKDEMTNIFINKSIKLFFYLIASGGELILETNSTSFPTPNLYQTKLRCCAGLQVLKLAKLPELNNFIKPLDIIKLINLVEDESLPVRSAFLEKLKENIGKELISIKFLPLIFFTAYEPESEVKVTTKTWINFTFSKNSFKKGTSFERALPRLIHAISHHPDTIEGFQETGDAYLNVLTTAVDYLVFYFDSIANQENFSLLYYLSERVKNYQDKVEDDANEAEDIGKDESKNDKSSKINSIRMYVIAEISQLILLQLKEKKNWQHSAYPGKLNLPGDLFQPFDSIKKAQASFKAYISQKYTEPLKNNIKIKIGRMISGSQTERQIAQKKLLAHEYQESTKTKRVAKRKRVNYSDDDSEEEGVDDFAYKPAGLSRSKQTVAARKKNLRTRKEIDYKDNDDDYEDS